MKYNEIILLAESLTGKEKRSTVENDNYLILFFPIFCTYKALSHEAQFSPMLAKEN